MNWKTVAIDELRNYEAVKLSLQNLPELIDRQNSAIKRIRTSDPETVVGGGGGDRDMLLSAIVYRDELQARLNEAKKTVCAIERALSALDEEELRVIDLMYIHRRKNAVTELCDEMGIEQATVYRKRNIALEIFICALYGYGNLIVWHKDLLERGWRLWSSSLLCLP